MKRLTFLFAAAAAVALGLVSSWAFGRVLQAQHPPSSHAGRLAVWVFTTDSVDEMARYADIVIVGKLVKRYPGRTAYSDGADHALEFELNDFLLSDEAVKGNGVGHTVTVERLSGTSVDGPVYEIGERYLLFLKKQPESDFYIVVNDEARFHVGPTGRLGSHARGRVAASLRGRRLEEARSLLAASLRTQGGDREE